MATSRSLTENQKRFCEEYIKDCNATRAYAAVYKNAKGEDSARTAASRLLTNENVQRYIEKLQRKHSKKLNIEARDILSELKHIGLSRIDNVLDFDDSGVSIKSSKKLPKEVLSSIQSVTVLETENSLKKEVKLYDKISALKQLGESLGLFKDFDTLIRGIEQYGEITWHEDMDGFSFRYADSEQAKA